MRTPSAQQLRRILPQYEISDRVYDRGYWSRIAGLPQPRQPRAQAGWQQADQELRHERS